MVKKTHTFLFRTILALFWVCAYYVFAFSLIAAADSSSGKAVEMNNQAIIFVKKGQFERALPLLRSALSLDSSSPEIRRNLSQTLVERASELLSAGKSDAAKPLLYEALDVDSANGPGWLILGDILYIRESRLEDALSAWQKALGLAPKDKRALVIDRITKAKLDQSVERNFEQISTDHFLIRYHQGFDLKKIETMGQFMEERYELLSRELGVAPQAITLIVYPTGSFERINRRADWAVGLYDGRIRLREDDIGSLQEKTILSHELAHAFLFEGFGGTLPTWVHEGYAQLKEFQPGSSINDPEMQKALENRYQWIPIKWLDKRFSQPDSDADVNRAYIEARMAVKHLLDRFGGQKFALFLKKMSEGQPLNKAFDETYRPARFSRFSAGIFE